MYFHFPYFHSKNLFFTAVKHIFHIFTGLLQDYFLLIYSYQCKHQNNKNKYIINRKLSFFSINMGYIFILWYENYRISQVASAHTTWWNKSRTWKKKTFTSSIYNTILLYHCWYFIVYIWKSCKSTAIYTFKACYAEVYYYYLSM